MPAGAFPVLCCSTFIFWVLKSVGALNTPPHPGGVFYFGAMIRYFAAAPPIFLECFQPNIAELSPHVGPFNLKRDDSFALAL